ncbi:MAG: hypothetical protein ACOCSK_00540 [Rhodothermales bacterium]
MIQDRRQSGKKSLVKQVGIERGYAYLTFDNDPIRTATEAYPAGYVGELPHLTILDEVQRVPDICLARHGSATARPCYRHHPRPPLRRECALTHLIPTVGRRRKHVGNANGGLSEKRRLGAENAVFGSSTTDLWISRFKVRHERAQASD